MARRKREDIDGRNLVRDVRIGNGRDIRHDPS